MGGRDADATAGTNPACRSVSPADAASAASQRQRRKVGGRRGGDKATRCRIPRAACRPCTGSLPPACSVAERSPSSESHAAHARVQGTHGRSTGPDDMSCPGICRSRPRAARRCTSLRGCTKPRRPVRAVATGPAATREPGRRWLASPRADNRQLVRSSQPSQSARAWAKTITCPAPLGRSVLAAETSRDLRAGRVILRADVAPETRAHAPGPAGGARLARTRALNARITRAARPQPITSPASCSTSCSDSQPTGQGPPVPSTQPQQRWIRFGSYGWSRVGDRKSLTVLSLRRRAARPQAVGTGRPTRS